VTQQSLRLGANEQPYQFATDVAIKLQDGKSAEAAVPIDKVDLSKSMDTFVMIYNNQPVFPKGVLDYTAKNGEDRITWQPDRGLRFATVAIKFDKGYIVAGHSLQETEKLIDTITKLYCLRGWQSGWVPFIRRIGLVDRRIRQRCCVYRPSLDV
jgi:hypothetical protein